MERVSVRCCKVSLVCFQKQNKNISLVCHFKTISSADGQIGRNTTTSAAQQKCDDDDPAAKHDHDDFHEAGNHHDFDDDCTAFADDGDGVDDD